MTRKTGGAPGRRLGPALASACLVVAWLLTAGLAAPAEARIALVIGNSKYETLGALQNPANDAKLMADTLRALDFEVILETDVDRRGLSSAVLKFQARLRDAGPSAVGLFYYAGHGVQSNGNNYLLPVGAPISQEAELDLEALQASWVLARMEEAGNRLNLVILDACRNNPFKSKFRSATRGLARMNAPRGSLIAYSAGPGEAAADGTGVNSPYTEALTRAMREPGLKVEEVFKRTRIEVERKTGQQQTPWEESSLRGEFYFTPAAPTQAAQPKVAALTDGTGAQPAAPVPRDSSVEITFWNTVQETEDPALKKELLKTYLESYPDGAFVALARAQIRALETQSAALTPAPQPTPSPAPATQSPRSGPGLTTMDEIMIVRTRSNVRDGPSTSASRIGRLEAGSEVTVTARVEGESWYRIETAQGETAYIHDSLLVTPAAWAQAQARAAQLAAQRSAQPANPPQQAHAGSGAPDGKLQFTGLTLDPHVKQFVADTVKVSLGGHWDKAKSVVVQVGSLTSHQETDSSAQVGAALAQAFLGTRIPVQSQVYHVYRANVTVTATDANGRPTQGAASIERFDYSPVSNSQQLMQALLDGAQQAASRLSIRLSGGTPDPSERHLSVGKRQPASSSPSTNRRGNLAHD